MDDNFSVLIGVYHKDNPEYFKQAMNSILNQTIKSNDILISVDGAIDEKLKKIVNYYNQTFEEVKILWLSQNVGLGKSFQKALPLCKNEIVFRADADDISIPQRFEIQLNYLKKFPQVKLLSSNMVEFFEKTQNIVTIKQVPVLNNEITHMAKRWNPINHPATVFYKSAVLDAGSYQNFFRYEDYHLWIRMFLKGFPAANIDKPLVFFRLSSESLKRRTDWKTTKSAIKFHQWKYKVGFASWIDTIYMIIVTYGIFITPDFIFERIYRKIRKNRERNNLQ